LFIDERKIKYVFLSGAITALLSWEKFALTDFFIDYVPMYNKFPVSSIQVILELCFPF
jgi:hypothetical protein